RSIPVSWFRNGTRRAAGRGFRAGIGGACRELFDRCDAAGVAGPCASDRAVDGQCRGVLAVPAGPVRGALQPAWVARAGLRGSGRAGIGNTVNLAVLAGVVAAICHAMMRVDGADLFPAPPEVQADTIDAVAVESSAADQKLIDALMRLMGDERIYRHDNVTIG